jgi:hypothetical protein
MIEGLTLFIVGVFFVLVFHELHRLEQRVNKLEKKQ